MLSDESYQTTLRSGALPYYRLNSDRHRRWHDGWLTR